MRMTQQIYVRTHKLKWTPLGYKCIATLDFQAGNVFLLVSSVGVQNCNAFIWVKKGPQATRQTDIKITKVLWATGQMDGQTYYTDTERIWTCGLRTQDLKNYELREWTFIANLEPFFNQNFWYNIYLNIYIILRWFFKTYSTNGSF